jgi:DmsE family decaheme c-type cytochrome
MPVKPNSLAAENGDYDKLFYLVTIVTKVDHRGDWSRDLDTTANIVFRDGVMTDKFDQPSHRRFGGVIAWLALLFSLATLIVGVARADQTDVDNETCLECHEGYDSGLLKTGHALRTSGASAVACVSCHAGGSVHIDNPSKDNIANPATVEMSKTEKVCTTCHLDLTCTGCHSVHKPAKAGELPCQKCHVAVTHQFQQRSNHPLIEGTVSCVSCHDFLGKAEPTMGHGPSANCYACHTDQSGPFLFEHGATSSLTVDGNDGCVSCHNPHGSVNDRLLTQTGANLCKQCHGLPAGHMTAHEGQFSQVACVDCHSDIHGSYDNLFLLDPQLGTKFGREADACFCHYYR